MKPFSAKAMLLSLILLLNFSLPCFAISPGEALADPALEARARSISAELRCLVCQNQSIDNSDAELARDLRILVREHLKAGDSDQQIYDFLVARYGEFVLLRPRFGARTLLLWLTPALLLFLVGGAMWHQYRKSSNYKALPELSDSEKERLAKLVSQQ